MGRLEHKNERNSIFKRHVYKALPVEWMKHDVQCTSVEKGIIYSVSLAFSSGHVWHAFMILKEE